MIIREEDLTFDRVAEISEKMTSPEILNSKEFQKPQIIRPTEFTEFSLLLKYAEEIRNLRLVPVKFDDEHERYRLADKGLLFSNLLETMGNSALIIADNDFKYWLPDDVRQMLVWIRTDDEERVKRFIGAGILHMGLDPNEVILFERPRTSAILVKGTFPQMRHIHLWSKL
jgi:hypothetical protein